MITMWHLILARHALRVTQEELAQSLGVTRETINRLEKKTLKSKKMKDRMVGEYEEAGIHFVLDDGIDTPEGVGIILKRGY